MSSTRPYFAGNDGTFRVYRVVHSIVITVNKDYGQEQSLEKAASLQEYSTRSDKYQILASGHCLESGLLGCCLHSQVSLHNA